MCGDSCLLQIVSDALQHWHWNICFLTNQTPPILPVNIHLPRRPRCYTKVTNSGPGRREEDRESNRQVLACLTLATTNMIRPVLLATCNKLCSGHARALSRKRFTRFKPSPIMGRGSYSAAPNNGVQQELAPGRPGSKWKLLHYFR